MNKTAYIFDCYDDYDIRLRYIQEVLESEGYETTIYLTDFNHFTKQPVTERKDNIQYLHVLPYQRNLSVSRIVSHILFAGTCRIIQEEHPADLVYCMAPPNYLVKRFGQLRKKKPDFSLIIDICDLWPETFPSKGMKLLLKVPFSVWKNIRNNWLRYADVLLAECSLFKDRLLPYIEPAKAYTLYLCKDAVVTKAESLSLDSLSFAYVGSINHIIDIQGITDFLVSVRKQKDVSLHIIGDGEQRQDFLALLDVNNISYVYHGLVFDSRKKQEILKNCHFGINMMKDSVCVGLTMKSLDYLAYDLPLINNIPEDTWNLVERENIGFNISADTLSEKADSVSGLNQAGYMKMRENVIDLHQRLFTPAVFKKRFTEAVRSLNRNMPDSD